MYAADCYLSVEGLSRKVEWLIQVEMVFYVWF